MVRETAMRIAFTNAVKSVINSDKPVSQPRLVKRIAAKCDAGVGSWTPRGKR